MASDGPVRHGPALVEQARADGYDLIALSPAAGLPIVSPDTVFDTIRAQRNWG